MSTKFKQPILKEKFPMAMAGDFGIFSTDKDSPVFYINTSFDIENIGQLSPVREILDITEIDFEELVQRDLDDFRIRRDIAPYLTDGIGYKFFPPIVVAVTQPDEDKKSIQKYYPKIKSRFIGNKERFEIEFENSFCVRWFVDSENNNAIISLPTEIRWQIDNTNLMAVDGQHRLVALQAIRGIFGNDRLKRFYKNTSKDKRKLDNLKVPVTILFFPNSSQIIEDDEIAKLNEIFPKVNWQPKHKTDVKKILRNIFVDVNKTAKQPSKSRTILLDEKDLNAVFTRKVFSSIKTKIPKIYTAVLEYNSNNGKEVQIERNRAVITTIGMVHRICEFLFSDNPEKKNGYTDQGTNFRMRLGVDQASNFDSSDEFPKDKIKAQEFSLKQRKQSEKLFSRKWLFSFGKLYTELTPYKTLINLIQKEYDTYLNKLGKDDFDLNEDLALKTLFGGSEERFILESNAKSDDNRDSIRSLKLLKDIEKEIRDNVRYYDSFYTLMFQIGFFNAITELIKYDLFESNHHPNSSEIDWIITKINSYLEDNREHLFNSETPLYPIIINKSKPENSSFIKSLLLLILLNYSSEKDELIPNIAINRIEEINQSQLEIIENRMASQLEKEFNARNESKVRLA
ncbi:DNA sulfur modification protein DndB, partial [Christiangramia marina]|uniref:DNA sulfur modification protein DndB n=1 Tax=Christiangramia marina TaxID=409436 RepID=UPI003AA7AD3D